MRSRLLFAIPVTVILGGLMVLHVYWALGDRWGSAYSGPTVNGRAFSIHLH
jgi:hypothetical protein